MYDYIALKINATPCNEDITDLLAAYLAESHYETFDADPSGLTAYIRKDKFDSGFVEKVISEFPIPSRLSFNVETIKGQDWNKEWEQNYFQPILIDDTLLIRSSFHDDYPQARIEILIDPKMAFGTGHHATTAGMARLVLQEDLRDKTVIDMGTGTGILAILAKKLGALHTVGIDIDEFAIENAIENSQLNNTESEWIVGDDEALNEVQPADIFLANINRNIILENLHKYSKFVKPHGKIFLSGFLVADKPDILKAAKENGLQPEKEIENNNWLALSFIKIP